MLVYIQLKLCDQSKQSTTPPLTPLPPFPYSVRTMSKIAVIPGDGTGPEVVAEGVKVLTRASKKFKFPLELTSFDWGGTRYLKTGETLPPDAITTLRGFDAIFLGAIGHPEVKPGILEQGILLRLRFE